MGAGVGMRSMSVQTARRECCGGGETEKVGCLAGVGEGVGLKAGRPGLETIIQAGVRQRGRGNTDDEQGPCGTLGWVRQAAAGLAKGGGGPRTAGWVPSRGWEVGGNANLLLHAVHAVKDLGVGHVVGIPRIQALVRP